MKSILQEEEAVKQAVEQLDRLLCDLPQIQEFQALAKKVRGNEGLARLEAAIKVAQQEAVQFGHYGKENARQAALKQAEKLTKDYDEHPLVVAYRAQLVEVNDVIQYVTERIQRAVEELE